jgi:P4 family phage/plasmid primase-like protien
MEDHSMMLSFLGVNVHKENNLREMCRNKKNKTWSVFNNIILTTIILSMVQTLKYYKAKSVALKNVQENMLLANRRLTHYFVLSNHNDFLDVILTSVIRDYYEYVPKNVPVHFFFDIEIYKQSCQVYFDDPHPIIQECIQNVKSLLAADCVVQTIVLESHSDIKKSFHVILRIRNGDNVQVLFENVQVLKRLYKRFDLGKFRDDQDKHLVDPSVYREGLFRTLYSSKVGENRPLVRCSISDDFEDIESFVCYKSNNFVLYTELEELNTDDTCPRLQVIKPQIVNVPEEMNDEDVQILKRFVQREFHHYPNRIRDVFIDKQFNCIIVALNEKYCPIADKEHKGNNQYIVIDTSGAKQKCHDTECNLEKYMEFSLERFPKEVNEIIKKCLKVNQQELDLIDHAIVECRHYIHENFDKQVKNVSFDRNAMIFRGSVEDRNLTKILKGQCPECNVEHQIGDTGYCLKCTKCLAIFPKQQIIPIDTRYKTLNSFWMNYSQLVNNGTINNIINIYNGPDIEFSCDIKLDNSIFKNKDVTNIVNQVLDGHKVTMISKLLQTMNNNFVYSRSHWYFFSGSIWKHDGDNIEMKKELMDLSKLFERIKLHYDDKQTSDTTMSLNKNIKSLINKFHKPGFQDDVIKGAKIYCNDENFIAKLNSKKHLVPFNNGVYDLLEGKFRKTKKDDFVNLTMSYEYDETVKNPEVFTFLEQVIPNLAVRNYVLKKMSECLNGDIPNTYFLMFIGDSGANGKSQLLNLMKLAMGDFGEKVEVTLLTRKRNNANEANSEKIKLLHKRFAFLSEPEDGEKINIGLLKELTGSEEIVARGLYQDSVSFVMEAKLFLACNELPEIKGEDTALWRRIRVVDFPSRFVDEPTEAGEFKIDRTLPSRMREDITWRQTFMNILLDLYDKDFKEPREVQVKTNEYRQENNDFYNWLEENVENKAGSLLQTKDVCELYLCKTKIHSKESSKYKKEIEKWIKEKFKNLQWEYSTVKIGEKSYKGWKDLSIKED